MEQRNKYVMIKVINKFLLYVNKFNKLLHSYILNLFYILFLIYLITILFCNNT